MNNAEFAEIMRQRTKTFAVDIIKLYNTFPKTLVGQVIGKQLIRSATSVASNYRAACRGRSDAEFYSKLCISVEESDETLFWLEILIEINLIKKELIDPCMKEANELLAILARSRKTLKNNL
jgi:four helix bundle protein